MATVKIIQLARCPRCEKPHKDFPIFEFKKRFMRVEDKVYTRWAYCPDLMEPIVLSLEQDLSKLAESNG